METEELLGSYQNSRGKGKITAGGRLIDQKWVDEKLLRRWKQICNNEICRKSHRSTRLETTFPAWLIDTKRMCLIAGTTEIPYAALSYVWGKTPFFKTTNQNLAQLQLDSALGNSQKNLGIPRSISDAISTVGLLEERYLWIDTLCIVQDDDLTRNTEINNIASIFSGAVLTIIAENGNDANHGLLGLRNISP